MDYLSGISMIFPDNGQRNDEIVYVSEDIFVISTSRKIPCEGVEMGGIYTITR